MDKKERAERVKQAKERIDEIYTIPEDLRKKRPKKYPRKPKPTEK